MLKRIIWVGMVMSLSVSAWADYLSDRKAAIELIRSSKEAEALVAFTNMATGSFSDLQKSDALEQAAYCANRLRQYEQALALAKTIPLLAVSKKCRINLRLGTRQYSELISEFKTEDIDIWPESTRGDALYGRGIAYYKMKDEKSAEADLKKAVDYLHGEHSLGMAWVTLGDIYRDCFKDDQKALEVYAQEAKTLRNGYGYPYAFTAVLSSSDILRKQGKYDEALQMLGKIDMKQQTGDWSVKFHCAYGETLGAQGKKAEAIAKFNEALAVKGISDGQKTACEKKIKELQAKTEGVQ